MDVYEYRGIVVKESVTGWITVNDHEGKLLTITNQIPAAVQQFITAVRRLLWTT